MSAIYIFLFFLTSWQKQFFFFFFIRYHKLQKGDSIADGMGGLSADNSPSKYVILDEMDEEEDVP